jgi:LPPG:FO 2-phospho-L-lactate transferase
MRKKLSIAVSPIIGGQTIKGPAAKMYQELGIRPSALAVARHYQDHLSGFVMDRVDNEQEEQVTQLGVKVYLTDTIMKTAEDRRRLAEETLSFYESIEGRQSAL